MKDANDLQGLARSERDIEGDPLLLAMAQALHAGVRDEPFARMDFSDAQWARLEAAGAVVRAPLVTALIELERWITEDSDCCSQAQRTAGRKALIAARAAIEGAR